MPKEKWEKPKLVILTRGKPEERVLVACKLTPPCTESTGPQNGWSRCMLNPGNCAIDICTDSSPT